MPYRKSLLFVVICGLVYLSLPKYKVKVPKEVPATKYLGFLDVSSEPSVIYYKGNRLKVANGSDPFVSEITAKARSFANAFPDMTRIQAKIIVIDRRPVFYVEFAASEMSETSVRLSEFSFGKEMTREFARKGIGK